MAVEAREGTSFAGSTFMRLDYLSTAAEPALLIADEPTTGRDMTMQVVVPDLIRNLVHCNRKAVILVTHDLALASESCD